MVLCPFSMPSNHLWIVESFSFGYKRLTIQKFNKRHCNKKIPYGTTCIKMCQTIVWQKEKNISKNKIFLCFSDTSLFLWPVPGVYSFFLSSSAHSFSPTSVIPRKLICAFYSQCLVAWNNPSPWSITDISNINWLKYKLCYIYFTLATGDPKK